MKVADKVEFITPARFLFNAGGTPTKWNEKILNDSHFKVEKYYNDASEIFPNTEIKGGVAVSYFDTNKDFGAIKMFTPYSELNTILKKVEPSASMAEIITNRGIFRYSAEAFKQVPDEMKKTSDKRIAPSCFERMPILFTDEKPNDGVCYIRIIGVQNGIRKTKWFRKDYVACKFRKIGAPNSHQRCAQFA